MTGGLTPSAALARHPVLVSTLPAATTTTTFLASTAYRSAAPTSASWLRPFAATPHAASEMLMTVEPWSAAQTMDDARVLRSPGGPLVRLLYVVSYRALY